jgi:feruloyl esterase
VKRLLAIGGALALLAGCAQMPGATSIGAKPQVFCDGLAGKVIPAGLIGLPSGDATIDQATLVAATDLAMRPQRAPTPAGSILPAKPRRCEVKGHIAPRDPNAPPIRFQVNLPTEWNGRSVQYGGGGFNGTVISGEDLLPAARYDQPAPLALGYVTYGTDSGHEDRRGVPPQAFALNDEALENFAYASYKKVRDVAVALMKMSYGHAPRKMYFVGSSEGGREALTMAQRFPRDFDGIIAGVPVIRWTGLQHAGIRDGIALMNGAWINPAQVKLVHDAVLAACDAADGLADGIVSDPVGCRQRFDIAKLRCTGAPADNCLTELQIRAVQTLHSRVDLGVAVANGLNDYPGRGPSGEGIPSFGPTGGWQAWWTGTAEPRVPPIPQNGIAWFFGAGAIQYFYARDPLLDVRRYRIADHLPRVQQVSALMDSTNPDLSAFRAGGGKLILLENLGDYAQSPYAGIEYHDAVAQKLGRDATDSFFKLYTAPNVDHVGTGGPANADLFAALVAWAEQGQAPAGLTLVEQDAVPPFAVKRSRPLCEWPAVPRYRGGDPNAAASFACAP